MNCFYLIDKPLEITSFGVLKELRKRLMLRKLGHTGTLDPLASGLLLVGVGKYTKLIPYFEKDTKEYEFKVMLNGTTPSFDLETQVSFLPKKYQEKFKKELNKEYIKETLEKYFTGEIYQVPPKYSAIKVGGKKALKMVRAGEEFEIKKRKVNISSIEILSFSYPELYLKATVSAGTYVRSIASDLGDILGTGGYVSFLRRTKIGKLDLKYAQKLDDFDSSKMVPEKELFSKENFISLDNDILEKVNHGLKVKADIFLKEGKDYFIMDDKKITNIIKFEDQKIVPVKKI